MRIAFDGSTLRPGRTGVGYYTEHLLEHLVDCGSDEEWVVISNRAIETSRPLPPCVTLATASWRLPRLVWMQAVAPGVLRSHAVDVAHFTNGMMPIASPVPTVVTIHDMSLTLYPRYHPPRRVLLNRPLVDLAARRADAIITVSDAARQDIVRLYGVSADRVYVVHEAAAPHFRRVTDPSVLRRVKTAYGLADRVILYVGTIEPRKNLPMLIEAFARRRQAGELPHQLVCAGPYGWLSSDLQQLIDRWQVRDAVRITGYVPFEDLPAIYSLSEVFVYPSVYEGFGLPVVEALACGTPTLIAPIPALIEVAGGAAARMPSNDVESLGDTLVALTGNREWRDDLSRMALERAGQFSWRRAARETLAVYRHVVHGRRTTVHSPSSSRTDKTPASGPPAAAARTSQQP